MADDIYDIMPHKEISDLKKQLQDLKTTKQPAAGSPDLTKSMTALTSSMDSMLKLFSEAAEEMKLEGKEETELATKLEPLYKKMDEISEQNKTIAEGIIALSDMIKDFLDKQQAIKPAPKPMFSDPGFSAPSFGASMDDPFKFPPQASSNPNPFPSLGDDQPKRGIFGRIKR